MVCLQFGYPRGVPAVETKTGASKLPPYSAPPPPSLPGSLPWKLLTFPKMERGSFFFGGLPKSCLKANGVPKILILPTTYMKEIFF